MDVRISLDDEDALSELSSLEDWLLTDPSLRECEFTRETGPNNPTEMGALFEVLIVALGSGGLGAALATSISTWMRTRVSHVKVRLAQPTTASMTEAVKSWWFALMFLPHWQISSRPRRSPLIHRNRQSLRGTIALQSRFQTGLP